MICKYCKDEIHTVLNIQSGTAAWVLDSNGEYKQHSDAFFDPDDEQNDFCCPVCLKVLFLAEEGAIKALKE